MPEAYTVSKMLSNINQVMAPVATDVCGSVTLQRKTENGIMLNTSEKEIAYLDTRAKIKHSAQNVAQLDKPAKARWVAAQRLAGNEAFHRKEYQQAAEAYIQALTALDFGSTPQERLACQQKLQIPLTCNIAACMLMLEQWDKTRQMCDQVLALDSTCVKALQQRAKSMTKIGRFDDARADVLLAKRVVCEREVHDSDQLEQRLDKQLEDISRAERRDKHFLQQQKRFQTKMMKQAVGKLYSDKKEVNYCQNISAVPPQQLLSLGSFSDWNIGIAWIIGVFASLIRVIYSHARDRQDVVKRTDNNLNL